MAPTLLGAILPPPGYPRKTQKNQNLYAYVLGDPTNLVDPSGNNTATVVVLGLPRLAPLGPATLVVGCFAGGYWLGTQIDQRIVQPVFWSEDKPQAAEQNPKQDKLLAPGEIAKLKKAGIDPHDLKGGRQSGQRDLYKDNAGNIYVKPKGGQGPGEPTGININNL